METRIEKYREYRKSIISGEPTFKTQIETSLKATSKESQSSPTEQEAAFLRKIKRKEMLGSVSYLTFLLGIIIPFIVFGIILF